MGAGAFDSYMKKMRSARAKRFNRAIRRVKGMETKTEGFLHSFDSVIHSEKGYCVEIAFG